MNTITSTSTAEVLAAIQRDYAYWNGCPEDADDARMMGGSMCGACIPGRGNKDKFWCTRRKGHLGLHHAHNRKRECVATFTNEEAVIEAL